MIIVNTARELLTQENTGTEAYIKDNNMKVWLLQGQLHFIELCGQYTDYCFNHGYYDKDLTGLLRLLFKIDDLGLALYCMTHTYHEAAGERDHQHLGYLAVVDHPQYEQFFNTTGFSLEISRWNNTPMFSPFAEAKPQNLHTKRISAYKLVEAILAGQVTKVICNGNCSDDWLYDEETGNSKGEWDLMDFANHIYTTETNSFRTGYYHIERKDNEISVWAYHGECSENYTVYLAHPREIQDLIQRMKEHALKEEDKWYKELGSNYWVVKGASEEFHYKGEFYIIHPEEVCCKTHAFFEHMMIHTFEDELKAMGATDIRCTGMID